jgi:hypothetical protein
VASIRDPSGTTVTGSSSSLESGNGNSRLTVTITSDITANPTASSAIDVRTRSATPLGNYLVTLRGVSGIPAKTAEFTVTVGAGGGTTPLPVFEEF